MSFKNLNLRKGQNSEDKTLIKKIRIRNFYIFLCNSIEKSFPLKEVAIDFHNSFLKDDEEINNLRNISNYLKGNIYSKNSFLIILFSNFFKVFFKINNYIKKKLEKVEEIKNELKIIHKIEEDKKMKDIIIEEEEEEEKEEKTEDLNEEFDINYFTDNNSRIINNKENDEFQEKVINKSNKINWIFLIIFLIDLIVLLLILFL